MAGRLMTAIIASATVLTDVQVVGSPTAAQVLMTTPVATFDGGPVVVEFACEYVNHLPAAGTQLNGIGFDLMVDGVRMERLARAGTHGQDNNFWPVVLRDVLDEAPRLIPAGQHTVGIAVWKWCPTQDGYIKASPGYVAGWGMPIRLTVYRAA
jgi:hypothetical protein